MQKEQIGPIIFYLEGMSGGLESLNLLKSRLTLSVLDPAGEYLLTPFQSLVYLSHFLGRALGQIVCNTQGFVKGEELFSFCELTSSLKFIYRQRTN